MFHHLVGFPVQTDDGLYVAGLIEEKKGARQDAHHGDLGKSEIKAAQILFLFPPSSGYFFTGFCSMGYFSHNSSFVFAAPGRYRGIHDAIIIQNRPSENLICTGNHKNIQDKRQQLRSRAKYGIFSAGSCVRWKRDK